jgi:hypothetical protein
MKLVITTGANHSSTLNILYLLNFFLILNGQRTTSLRVRPLYTRLYFYGYFHGHNVSLPEISYLRKQRSCTLLTLFGPLFRIPDDDLCYCVMMHAGLTRVDGKPSDDLRGFGPYQLLTCATLRVTETLVADPGHTIGWV